MPDTLIENPILNSPYQEPTRHFRFGDEGITNEVVETRRTSSYFVPIPPPKKKGKQLVFDTEWTQDRIETNDKVNQIRDRVQHWREGDYQGITPVTRKLLQHWTDPDRENKLFFCQVEALETLVYLTESARKVGDNWIENWLRDANNSSNPGLNRVAMKMATGSGKTVVMAMLIAWHALNKLADPKDRRFSDTFLVVTPGITIRDRLRVLWPNDAENDYRRRDLVPPDLIGQLGRAKILITNFHAFQARKVIEANRLTKEILGTDFGESPAQMVNRVCRELGSKRNVVVINDEAHHCYRRKPDGEAEALKGEDRTEAEKRNQEARVWLSGVAWPFGQAPSSVPQAITCRGAARNLLDYNSSRGLRFPRPHRRGPIEASSSATIPTSPSWPFHAFIGVAPLKHRRLQQYQRLQARL
jgi:type III restriction enzyme